MEQEPNADNSQFWYKQEQEVCPNCRVGVERVKINSAAFRVIHWRCQKVVKVHNHGEYHNQPSLQPDFSISQAGCDAWDKDMQNKMQQWQNHLRPLSPREVLAKLLRWKYIFLYRSSGFLLKQ